MVYNLIKKLIEQTEKDTYCWDCIEGAIRHDCNSINVALRKFVVSNDKSYYNKLNWRKKRKYEDYVLFNSDCIHYPCSFTLNVEGGVVTLLTYINDEGEHYYKLFLQNTPKNDLVSVNTEKEHQEELKKLLELIKRKNGNVDGFIKKIIGES